MKPTKSMWKLHAKMIGEGNNSKRVVSPGDEECNKVEKDDLEEVNDPKAKSMYRAVAAWLNYAS